MAENPKAVALLSRAHVWVTCCVLVWRAGLINRDDVATGSWPSASQRGKHKEARLSVHSSAYLIGELKCFIVL